MPLIYPTVQIWELQHFHKVSYLILMTSWLAFKLIWTSLWCFLPTLRLSQFGDHSTCLKRGTNSSSLISFKWVNFSWCTYCLILGVMSRERALNFDQYETFCENFKPIIVWLWFVWLSFPTFRQVHSNSKEVSYLPRRDKYSNLKTTSHIKAKNFLCTKLLETALLAKHLICCCDLKYSIDRRP